MTFDDLIAAMTKTAGDGGLGAALCEGFMARLAEYDAKAPREKRASIDFLTEDQILEDPHFDPAGGYRDIHELRDKYKAYAAGDRQHWFAGSHGLHADLYGGSAMPATVAPALAGALAGNMSPEETHKTAAAIHYAGQQSAANVLVALSRTSS